MMTCDFCSSSEDVFFNERDSRKICAACDDYNLAIFTAIRMLDDNEVEGDALRGGIAAEIVRDFIKRRPDRRGL